jgi:hypothetical protein
LQAFVVVALLFLAGCAKKEADTTVPPSLQSFSINNLTKYLSNLLNTEEQKVIYNPGSKEFTIDGDMLISRAEAEKYFRLNQGARTEQRWWGLIVAEPFVRNIKVHIDPASVSLNWAIATRRAMTNWNNINSRVRFYEVLNGNDPGINIRVNATRAMNNDYYALAELPFLGVPGGIPGRYIAINANRDVEASIKEAVMVHELGHTVGLTHTDRPLEGGLIPGTPTLDPSSIMNAGVGPWKNFSTGDLQAIYRLYPR